MVIYKYIKLNSLHNDQLLHCSINMICLDFMNLYILSFNNFLGIIFLRIRIWQRRKKELSRIKRAWYSCLGVACLHVSKRSSDLMFRTLLYLSFLRFLGDGSLAHLAINYSSKPGFQTSTWFSTHSS